MKTLSQRKRRSLERSLDEREADLRRKIALERERMDSEGYGELAQQPGDVADHAVARIWIGQESHLLEHYLGEIRALVTARQRLAEGTFGVCVDCGDAIDLRRLAAVPDTPRCAACQARHEYREARRA